MSNNNNNNNDTTNTNHIIGGIYTDPFHSPITCSANIFNLPKPWFGGLRIIGVNDNDDDSDGKKFTTIGCDDGIYWWTLTGEFTDIEMGKIDMDFTPKAPGVGKLKCTYPQNTGGALNFLEDDGETIGNTWSRLVASTSTSNDKLLFDVAMKHVAFNEINGLYIDETIYKTGSFAGIRVVSDRLGKKIRNEIVIVGTDDGKNWWTINGGKWIDRQGGKFLLPPGPHTPKDSSDEGGHIHNGVIKFGILPTTTWTKMMPTSKTMDIHSLPKETTDSTSAKSSL